MTQSNLNLIHNEKPAFSRQHQGELSTWQYVNYLGILAKKKIISYHIPEENIEKFPREHPTKEHYSRLVELAKKAGLGN
jgi:hypothetical protein